MKNVYILYNWDNNEIIAASEDRSLIEEIMCDMFIDDVNYQWYWEQQYHNFEINDIKEMAEAVWNDMIEWYNDYIGIFEEVLI